MNEDQFPGNSHRDKKTAPEEKKIERVTTAEPIRRKKGLGRKFKDIFFKGDPRVIGHSLVDGILIPAAKDMIIDAVRDGVEKLVLGESHRTRRDRGAYGDRPYVAYNKISRGPMPAPERAMSTRARARHDFDDIVLQNRAEAEEVLEKLWEIVSKYDTATVADLYELVGIRSTHVDHKWGWSDLRGATVIRVRDGFLLELPDVQPMEM